jgi:DNA mismatch repair protein MutL
MLHPRQPIEILPLLVVEKIAAGEVIERPASVLKELVENAIDAGATVIDMTIETAGFSLIKIADNGCGIPASDLEKSVLSHATSKIRSADDLFAITTMGFRGEALASIAAVSRMIIASAADTSGLGNRIRSEGGIHEKIEPVSHGRGTTIEVRDLFFNVPARKKFMKSQRSEQLALVRAIEQVSLPFPGIHFILAIDGKKSLDLPSVNTPLERIGAVAGAEFARELIACRNESDNSGMEVVCFVSSPEKQEKRPRFQSLYVNLRRVDCDAITYSIREASERYLSGQFRPSFFCFLDIDPGRIDVNVHPAKQQIKFEDERRVAGFVYTAVKQGIGSVLAVPADMVKKERAPLDGPFSVPSGSLQEEMRLRRAFSTGNRFSGVDLGAAPGPPSSTPAAQGPSADEKGGDGNGTPTLIPFPTALNGNEIDVDSVNDNRIQSTSVQEDRQTAWNLISCYQIHEMYILAPIKNGILLIDQHAAHERVLFEQALDDMARGRPASQQLLFPVVVELTSVEKAVALSGASYFSAFGFETGDFGGNALSVSAIPFFMRSSDVDDTLRTMVRYLLDEKERDALRETEKRFAAAFACGAAIKAGQKLTQEEMNALVNSLFAAKNPYTCPHGRPTLVRMSLDELSRRFLR